MTRIMLHADVSLVIDGSDDRWVAYLEGEHPKSIRGPTCYSKFDAVNDLAGGLEDLARRIRGWAGEP